MADVENSKEAIVRFIEEAVILQDFDHPNVLQTLGICWPSGVTPRVVLPYMANGDLRSLIRRDSIVSSMSMRVLSFKPLSTLPN